MIDIFAGSVSHVQFLPGTDAADDAPAVADRFVERGAADAVGPVFAIKTLNYFEYSAIYNEGASHPETVAEFIQLGLVDIDGSAETAAKFKAAPSARIAPALFNAIYRVSSGN